jgi:iron complex transport system substrate-binding protein
VVRDDRGSLQRFDTAPQRIVSLLPSLTESVCALGACARLVGVDRYSDAPAAVRRLPKLGGLDDVLVERIVALRPDVVLAATAARVTGRLEGLGLQVVVLDSQTPEDVHRSLRLIATLLGTPDAAERVWDGIERDIAAAQARVPAALRDKRVYFEVGPEPYGAGAVSFIGQTLARLGLANVLPPQLGPFPKLNPEYVVRRDPDIVMGEQHDVAAMPSRPGWHGMRALRNGWVCGFDADRYEVLVRPGPRMGEAALVLAQCLSDLGGRTPP